MSDRKKFILLCAAVMAAAVALMLLLPTPIPTRIDVEVSPEAEDIMLDGYTLYEQPEEPLETLCININTDSAVALSQLPGIGEKLAQAIVDYRTEHGGFDCIEDIMNVSGIGEGKFNAIKDLIYVE